MNAFLPEGRGRGIDLVQALNLIVLHNKQLAIQIIRMQTSQNYSSLSKQNSILATYIADQQPQLPIRSITVKLLLNTLPPLNAGLKWTPGVLEVEFQ